MPGWALQCSKPLAVRTSCGQPKPDISDSYWEALTRLPATPPTVGVQSTNKE